MSDPGLKKTVIFNAGIFLIWFAIYFVFFAISLWFQGANFRGDLSHDLFLAGLFLLPGIPVVTLDIKIIRFIRTIKGDHLIISYLISIINLAISLPLIALCLLFIFGFIKANLL